MHTIEAYLSDIQTDLPLIYNFMKNEIKTLPKLLTIKDLQQFIQWIGELEIDCYFSSKNYFGHSEVFINIV
jgi:hypothetical protein